MRIVCPSCAAAYEVPADRLTPRRAVRCARCAEEWVPVQDIEDAPSAAHAMVPDANPSAEPLAMLPAITAMDRLAASTRGRGRPVTLAAAWVLTFGALGGGAAAAIVWREAVVHAWPPSARILGTPGGVLVNALPDERGPPRD